MPAPTTMQSNFSTICLSPSAGEAVLDMRGDAGGERFRQRGQEADRVCRDSIVGEVQDRRVAVGVDGEDEVGALDADAVLDRPGNAGGDIELRPDRLAGLADLPIGRRPALLHARARATPFAAERVGERLYELEILGALQA